ncbi:hypothetical protein, partial [Klebsiella pneumoniae]|uniref:hypothetical protein n=1 Tax=Klebsiella pneumoniae TaxID=573 RepID=UPI0039E124CA
FTQIFLMRPPPRCYFCPSPAALALLKERMPLRGQKKARGVGGKQAQHFLMRPTPGCYFCPCPAALALLKECSLRGQKKARGVGGQQAKRND